MALRDVSRLRSRLLPLRLPTPASRLPCPSQPDTPPRPCTGYRRTVCASTTWMRDGASLATHMAGSSALLDWRPARLRFVHALRAGRMLAGALPDRTTRWRLEYLSRYRLLASVMYALETPLVVSASLHQSVQFLRLSIQWVDTRVTECHAILVCFRQV
ncbi:hypothetical protein BC567DRAFT_223210 [Phyllosticta citribraziliensis]